MNLKPSFSSSANRPGYIFSYLFNRFIPYFTHTDYGHHPNEDIGRYSDADDGRQDGENIEILPAAWTLTIRYEHINRDRHRQQKDLEK